MADPDSRNSIASYATDASMASHDDYCNSGLVVSSSARSSALSPSHLMAIQRQHLEHGGGDDDTTYATSQQKTSRQSECPYVGDGELNGRRLRAESVDESVEDLDDEQQQHFMTSWMKRYPAPPATGAGAASPKPPQSNASTLSKAPLEEKPSTNSHKYATLTVDTLEPDSLYTSRSETEMSDAEPFRRNERNRATLARILAIDPSKQTAEATLSTQPQQCSIKGVQRFPPVRHQNEVAPYNHNIHQLIAEKANPTATASSSSNSKSNPTATASSSNSADGYAASGSDVASQALSPEMQAMHKLSNDYDDLTYKAAQVKAPKSPRPRMHLEENIHPYHVTANHRIPQSDSEAQVAALFPLTSPSGSAAAGRHFQTGPGAFYRPPSPSTSTCVSCFGVRSKPYNAKLAAIGSLNPRSPAPAAEGQQASKTSSPQCKSYHRLALLMALLAAILSLAALAITLLVFLGVLSNAGDAGKCACSNGNLGNVMPSTASSTTTADPSRLTTTTMPASNTAVVSNPAHLCTVCNQSLSGERGIPGVQGPAGPEGPRGPTGVTSVLLFNASQDQVLQQCRKDSAGNLRVSSATGLVEQCVTTTTGGAPRSAYQAVQFQCPTDWVQYGNFCFGEPEQASVFNYTIGHTMCDGIPGLFFEAKPLVITSRLMALMAFTLVNGREIWIGSRTAGDFPEVQVANGVSSPELRKSKLITGLTGVGCDSIQGFNTPNMDPIVRRGPCDTKRPALCAVYYPHA